MGNASTIQKGMWLVLIPASREGDSNLIKVSLLFMSPSVLREKMPQDGDYVITELEFWISSTFREGKGAEDWLQSSGKCHKKSTMPMWWNSDKNSGHQSSVKLPVGEHTSGPGGGSTLAHPQRQGHGGQCLKPTQISFGYSQSLYFK